MKVVRIIQIFVVLYATEAKPLFLWKKLCGLYGGGYANPFVTNFPIITININANLSSLVSNGSIIFLNTTPTNLVTLIDPRLQQIGLRQKLEAKTRDELLTTTSAPFVFGSLSDAPEKQTFDEYAPAFTFPSYQTTLQSRSLVRDSAVLTKDKKVACAARKPACPINGYHKTSGVSNSQGVLANGCPCTDFNKIALVLRNVAGK